MRKHRTVLIATIIVLSACTLTAVDARPVPHWVEVMRAEPTPEWDGWRNSLAPDGDAATLTDAGKTAPSRGFNASSASIFRPSALPLTRAINA